MTQHTEIIHVPDFATREEEAKWFDEHDMGEYLDDFQLVDSKEVRVAKQLSENLTVRLTPEFLGRLRREAERKGIGPSTLARMWIMEHLHDLGEGQLQRQLRK